MQWPPPSATSASRKASRGFTLLELMIGLMVGLLASLAVAHVMRDSEAQKRAATSGSDAQVNGALALATLQRSIQDAGYGFTQVPGLIGCDLSGKYNGSTVTGLPAKLTPVLITDGGTSGQSDTIRVFSGGKSSYAIPMRMKQAYSPGSSTAGQQFTVVTTLGVATPTAAYPGDLMVAGADTSKPCQMFRVTSLPAANIIGRVDDSSGWNASSFPSESYVDGNFVVNLGLPIDLTYSIGSQSMASKVLRFSSAGAPSYSDPEPLFPNIVNLQALYGKDTAGNGKVGKWDSETPTDNAGWQQVIAVRVAVVARSAQFEKEDVTATAPVWDVGKVVPVTDATACGTSECLPVQVSHLTDWRRYRYKVFETVIPLKNMLWRPI